VVRGTTRGRETGGAQIAKKGKTLKNVKPDQLEKEED